MKVNPKKILNKKQSENFIIKNIPGIIFFFLILFLIFYRLKFYPQPWFDEGIHLLLAKQLASGQGYPFDTTLGPTIILPVSLSMRIAGIYLLPARIIMSIYLGACIFVFYKLTAFLCCIKTAIIASFFLVISPGVDLLYLGRQMLGEVPALFYFLAATILFFKTLKNENKRYNTIISVLVGILFSLSILSKYQLLILLPAWLLYWLINILYYKKHKNLSFFIPFLTMLSITTIWLLFVNQHVPKNAEQTTQFLSRGILNFSFTQFKESIKFLISKEMFWGWYLPGFLLAFIKSVKKSQEGVFWGWLFTISLAWLIWFVLFSVSWPRYAFLISALGSIFVTEIFSELTNGFSFPHKKDIQSLLKGKINNGLIINIIILAFLAINLGFETLSQTKLILISGNNESYQISEYVKKHTPENTIIETYEPAICFLADAACHLPPSEIMDASITYIWYKGSPPSEIYKLEENLHPYLLTGPFSTWVKLYDQKTIKQYYEFEIKIGEYNFFHLKENK